MGFPVKLLLICCFALHSFSSEASGRCELQFFNATGGIFNVGGWNDEPVFVYSGTFDDNGKFTSGQSAAGISYGDIESWESCYNKASGVLESVVFRSFFETYSRETAWLSTNPDAFSDAMEYAGLMASMGKDYEVDIMLYAYPEYRSSFYVYWQYFPRWGRDVSREAWGYLNRNTQKCLEAPAMKSQLFGDDCQ